MKIDEKNTPFEKYITDCANVIRSKRQQQTIAPLETIVRANSPFELKPASTNAKVGLLMIHGLLDCPFTMRDLADRFAENGFLCRSILLPGHGTIPHDLINVNYQDWIKAVNYGVVSLRGVVDQIFLVGYSMGGTLALLQLLQGKIPIKGVLIIAPAFRIKFPLYPLVRLLPYLLNLTHKKGAEKWVQIEDEIDYAKYHSVPYNAVQEVLNLTYQIPSPLNLATPLYMVLTDDDETISTSRGLRIFKQNQHRLSKLLIYARGKKTSTDPKIIVRNSYFPNDNIDNFSHRSLLFAPDNHHYGRMGDFINASRTQKNTFYGGYIGILGRLYSLLNLLHLTSTLRCELTYNPDFDFLSSELIQFVKNISEHEN